MLTSPSRTHPKACTEPPSVCARKGPWSPLTLPGPGVRPEQGSPPPRGPGPLTPDVVPVGVVRLLHPPVAEGQLPHPVHAAVDAGAQAQVGSRGRAVEAVGGEVVRAGGRGRDTVGGRGGSSRETAGPTEPGSPCERGRARKGPPRPAFGI